MKGFVTSVLAVLGSLIGVGPAAGKPASYQKLQTRMTRMGSWFISYGRTLPPYQMSMLVVAGEGCLLELQSPMGDKLPGRPEMGTYFWKSPPAEAEALRALMERAQAEHASVKKAPAPVLPGTRFLTFGLGKKDAEKVDPLTSVPMNQAFGPAVEAFDDAALAMARKAVDHPYMTLRAKGTLHTQQITSDGEFVARLELTNVGIVPVTVLNPAHAGSPARVQVTLEAPDGEFQFMDVKEAEMVASKGAATAAQLPPTADAHVKLAPGESLALSLRVRRHLYLRRGSHKAALRYTSNNQGLDENEGLKGFVSVVAGTVTAAKATPPAR